MSTFREELRALVDEFRSLAPDEFRIGTRTWRTTPNSSSEGAKAPSSNAAVALLRDILYSELHCRIPPALSSIHEHQDAEANDAFVATLSAANATTITRSRRWRLRRQRGDGYSIASYMHVDFLVAPGDSQLDDAVSQQPNDNAAIVVRMPSEQLHISPGFYVALGETDVAAGAIACARLYWNVRASDAAALLHELTARLNAAGIPFVLKTADRPSAYVRSDALVVYLAREVYDEALPTIASVHKQFAAQLREPTSAMALRLGRGLAVADDPRGNESFGLVRCFTLAEVLMQTAVEGAQGVASYERICVGLANRGFDVDVPYVLNHTAGPYRSIPSGVA